MTEAEIESHFEEETKKIKTDIKEHILNIFRGRNIVQQKIKEFKQNFSKDVFIGTISASGKIVFSHFDLLKHIFRKKIE